MQDAWPMLPGALVDLGGDLALTGATPEGGPWRIDIVDPRTAGATAARLLLSGGGVATSGRDIRRFGPDRSLHHLIDPSTGAPAEPGPLAVTVVARDAAEAEAHATALAISSSEEAAAHVAANPHISALVVPHAGAPFALGALPIARTRVLVDSAAPGQVGNVVAVGGLASTRVRPERERGAGVRYDERRDVRVGGDVRRRFLGTGDRERRRVRFRLRRVAGDAVRLRRRAGQRVDQVVERTVRPKRRMSRGRGRDAAAGEGAGQ